MFHRPFPHYSINENKFHFYSIILNFKINPCHFVEEYYSLYNISSIFTQVIPHGSYRITYQRSVDCLDLQCLLFFRNLHEFQICYDPIPLVCDLKIIFLTLFISYHYGLGLYILCHTHLTAKAKRKIFYFFGNNNVFSLSWLFRT